GLSAAAAALLLAACGNGGSAVETRDRAETAADAAVDAVSAPAPDAAPEDEAARGRPVWAPNRSNTGEENARLRFQRNGADFEAETVDDYVAQVHAFIGDPPEGTETVRRANGDTLYYHPESNTFAVATRDG